MTICSIWNAVNINISFRHCAVLEFLVKEGNAAAKIHFRLQCIYGDVCMVTSSVRRWIKCFKNGNTNILDEPHSSCPWTSSTECNKESRHQFFRENGCATMNEFVAKCVVEQIKWLGYWKVCSHWVPHILTKDHTFQRTLTPDLLQRFQCDVDDFWQLLWQPESKC